MLDLGSEDSESEDVEWMLHNDFTREITDWINPMSLVKDDLLANCAVKDCNCYSDGLIGGIKPEGSWYERLKNFELYSRSDLLIEKDLRRHKTRAVDDFTKFRLNLYNRPELDNKEMYLMCKGNEIGTSMVISAMLSKRILLYVNEYDKISAIYPMDYECNFDYVYCPFLTNIINDVANLSSGYRTHSWINVGRLTIQVTINCKVKMTEDEEVYRIYGYRVENIFIRDGYKQMRPAFLRLEEYNFDILDFREEIIDHNVWFLDDDYRLSYYLTLLLGNPLNKYIRSIIRTFMGRNDIINQSKVGLINIELPFIMSIRERRDKIVQISPDFPDYTCFGADRTTEYIRENALKI